MFNLALAAFMQLAFCLLANAAPVTTQNQHWQAPTGGGIVGLIVLILDIIAWGKILLPSISVVP
jgi:hypothetical protein